jgi:glycosyltransferase involved in cell wall biosynthesis
MVVSVGHLVPAKGHAIAIEAVAGMPDVRLVVVGTGPEGPRLQRLADRLGAAGRVDFLGLVPHEEMPAIYNAADALVLASANEGMPNVVLESIACGTRVVATDVGGVGEVVDSPEAGLLVEERSAAALRNALARLFEQNTTVEETRRFACGFGWSAVVEKQLSVYRKVLAGVGPAAAQQRG